MIISYMATYFCDKNLNAMQEMFKAEISFIYYKTNNPHTVLVEVPFREWEAAQRLPLESRLDYLYHISDFDNFRPFHYKVRKIDIRILP